MEKEFASVDGSPFFKIDSKFWVKNCLFDFAKIDQCSLIIHAYGTYCSIGLFPYFRQLVFKRIKYKEDQTVQQLYETFHNLVMEELKHKRKSVEPLQSFLAQVKRKIDSMDQEIAKKLKDCVHESLEMISEQNKLLSTASNQDNINDNKYTEEDILFIESSSTVGKNKNWNKLKLAYESIMATHERTADDSIINSILAAVNSERADSSNRHSHLWKVEYKLSGTLINPIMYNSAEHVHGNYDEKWVKKKIHYYVKGKGANSIKILLQRIQPDMSDLLTELQFTHVADLITMHVEGSKKSLLERMNCVDREEGVIVVTNILSADKLTSESKLISSLGKYYDLICYLDYQLYNMYPNNGVTSRWWEFRQRFELGSSNRSIKNEGMKMIAAVFNLVGATVNTEDEKFALTERRWNGVVNAKQVINLIRDNNWENAYALLFNRKNNLNSDEHKYGGSLAGASSNRFISKFVGKIGLKLDLKNTNVPAFKDVASSMCVVKALVSEDHYIQFEYIIPFDIRQKVEGLWASYRQAMPLPSETN